MKTTLAPAAPWPSFAVLSAVIAASNERLATRLALQRMTKKAHHRPHTYQKAKP